MNLRSGTVEVVNQSAADPAITHDRPTLLPLIIGINGKLDLGAHAAAVEDRLVECLHMIAAKHCYSPLMILTSLAEGADWRAARATARFAAKRPDTTPYVKLVCPLPLQRPLYEQDFSDAYKEKFGRLLDFGELVGDRNGLAGAGKDLWFPRRDLIWFALNPLAGARESEMMRDNGRSGAHRTIHYEQVGIFIADNCHLLISVMPEDEKPDRIGGTARIVHYKCTGALPPDVRFDQLVADLESGAGAIASLPAHNLQVHRLKRLSAELTDATEPADWFSRRIGHVWQLTVEAAPRWIYRKGSELKVGTGRLESYPGEQPRPSTEGPFAAGLVEAKRGDIFRVWRPYRIFNEFLQRPEVEEDDRESSNLSTARFSRELRETMGVEFDGKEHARLVHLFDIRRALSMLQRRFTPIITASFNGLATLFVVSVLMFTLFKVTHEVIWAIIYMVLVAAGAVFYLEASHRRWTSYHEDYRAAAEALRVQLWWRAAGIPDRVEHFYLPGTTQYLEHVRHGIETVNILMALTYRREQEQPVHQKLIAYARKKWADDQRTWFAQSAHQRRSDVTRYLLRIVSSFALATGLLISIIEYKLGEHSLIPNPHEPVLPHLYVLVALLAVCWLPFVHRFRLAPWLAEVAANGKAGERRVDLPDQWFVRVSQPPLNRFLVWSRWPQVEAAREWAITWTGGINWPLVYVGLWAAFPMLLGWLVGIGLFIIDHALGSTGVSPLVPTLGVVVAVLNAVAAALVYRREKSAAEPELRNYREMAHVFATAEQLLDATPQDDIDLQHRILRELGQAALAENAYWLRAHRERPIEQIPGA
jgi:hypothetical protein